ncbi:hypothetical protein PR202_gb23427 [Eleusine coracana subsp. coracana]|uniref:RNase III domain-containing protein n=1 Tax=Eleusine coracana subsp. coracana TaxID=191504 RepID=A0AAV5FI82_ELECO|nr:hypothetical protein PR202_gb23427 [Eleusine coracana subsp. coracana]
MGTAAAEEEEETSSPIMAPHVAREHREQHGQDAPPGFVPPMSAEDVAAVEAVLDYEFADKSLVEQALTHGSFYYPYRPGETYERLEYLGDGVLTCLMSREVFRTYRTLPPGPLTRLRAANVDKEKLARVAVVRGLDRFLRHKAPFLEGQIDVFIKEMCMYPVHSNGLLDPPKVLSDIVESLIGAIYFDSNFNQEEAWRKTRRGVKFVKDEWDKNLKVEVLIDGELAGSAIYAQKKEIAQNRAAKAALDKLKQTMGQYQTESVSAEVSEQLDTLNLAGKL